MSLKITHLKGKKAQENEDLVAKQIAVIKAIVKESGANTTEGVLLDGTEVRGLDNEE